MFQGDSLRVNESIGERTSEDPYDEDLYMYNRELKRMVRELFVFHCNNLYQMLGQAKSQTFKADQ